jgi:hypothetical protein
MKKLLIVGAFLMGSANLLVSQCTTFSGGPYTDFNSIGGAPCLEQPVRILNTFEAWASESYLIDGIQAGITYKIDICSSPAGPAGGGLAWPATFTILGPTGLIITSGTDGATGVNKCTKTFTATVSGEYEIGISEVGFCPGGPNTAVNNGYPRITYVQGPISSCAPPVSTCEAGTLVNNQPNTLCPGETAELTVTGVTIPNSPTIGGQGVRFEPTATGTGGLGGTFILSGVTMPYTFDRDLNGVLSANGYPPFFGTWLARPVVYADQANAFASICDTTFRSKPVTFLAAGGPGCEAFACEAGTVTGANQLLCPGDTWNLTVTGETLPSPGEFLWFFFAQDTVANDDYAYSFGDDPTFYNYSGDLNADLIAAALDPIAPGAYNVLGAVYDLNGDSICSVSVGSFELVIYAATDPACSACQTPSNLDVIEIAFGTTNPRVNATWTNPEATTSCEVRGGRISNASYTAGEPEFANIANTRIINQTNGSTVNFNIALYNNPNIPFTIGARYGYDVRCQCADGSGFSDWANITPEATFVVPAPPPGVFVMEHPLGTSKASIAAVKSSDSRVIADIRKNEVAVFDVKMKRPSTTNMKALFAQDMTLYPNPTTNELNITISSAKAQNIDVRIFDMTGRSIMVTQISAQAGANAMNLNVSELHNGLYFIEVGSGDAALRRPFVKE